MSTSRLPRFKPELLALEDRLAPTAGMLDPTFHVDGLATIENAAGYNVAIDSAGRTIAVGTTQADVLVARFLADGAPDTSFGFGGKVVINFGGDEIAYDVAVDSQDRLVVAGFTFNGSDFDFAVARLTPSGALDTSFSGDGRHTISFGAVFDFAYGVAIDSLDRIVVLGETTAAASRIDFAVARLTAAGDLDQSFSGDGKTTIAFGTLDDFGYGVAIDSQNRTVVVGIASIGGDNEFGVARILENGELDPSFDGDGKLSFGFGTFAEGAFCVAFDSLDRVIVGGYSLGVQYDFAVARITETGELDSSFDGDGRVRFDFSNSRDTAFSVAADHQNRIVLAGNTQNGTIYDFAVARLTTDGALDTEFSGDGKTSFALPFTTARSEESIGVAIDSAGRPVVVGSAITSGARLAVARLTGDTTVATAQVNDGSAQRSRVTSLTVRFSGEVTFAGTPASAFTLVRNGGKAVSFTANVTVEYGGTVVTLTNFTGLGTQFGSLADGRYTLTAFASQISAGGLALDGDANGTPGGNFTFGDAQGLFRMYGDINGDRRVDIADFGLFALSFMIQANYVSAFDFNGDGRIDIVDFGQFAIRYFTNLP